MKKRNTTKIPPFSLLVKPAGPDCNLRCRYCFYLEKAELFPDSRIHRMSDELLERMIAGYMATEQPQYSFAWQGGEPTLMGTRFFKKVTELQKRHGRPGAVVTNGLQTNATLIDDELAEHLAEYRFLVGVSIDGPAVYHDAFRTNANGKGSHHQVLRGIELLHKHRVEFNTLTVVNSANGPHAAEVYDYLCGEGHLFQQYIPCVELDEEGAPYPHSVSPAQWGEFMCGVFDRWYAGDTRRVSVRMFDTILVKMVDGVANACTFAEDCRHYFLVEHNGDVFPCDFFAEPELRLGNIMEGDWGDFYRNPLYSEFGKRKSVLNRTCLDCEFLNLCAGDCPKHRYIHSRDPAQLSFLCEGWKIFYEHTLPRFELLAEEIRAEREAARLRSEEQFAAATRRRAPAPGNVKRNAPCPCGSGRKFKHCCGSPDRALRTRER